MTMRTQQDKIKLLFVTRRNDKHLHLGVKLMAEETIQRGAEEIEFAIRQRNNRTIVLGCADLPCH